MRMRLKASRGQQFKINGEYVIFLEKINETAKILVNERVTTVPIEDLELPIIDTRDYEKLPST